MYQFRPERGTKRSCLTCEARFYDMTRIPATCPKCGAECADIVRPDSPPQTRKRGRFAYGRTDQPFEAEDKLTPATDEERSEDDDAEPDDEPALDRDDEDEPREEDAE